MHLDRGGGRGSGVFFKRSLKLCKMARETGHNVSEWRAAVTMSGIGGYANVFLNFLSEGLSKAKGARKASVSER